MGGFSRNKIGQFLSTSCNFEADGERFQIELRVEPADCQIVPVPNRQVLATFTFGAGEDVSCSVKTSYA